MDVRLNLGQLAPEAVPEPAAEAVLNVGGDNLPKNKVGRPKGKKPIPCQPNQPALHRFFGSGVKVVANRAALIDAADDTMEIDDTQGEARHDYSSESDDDFIVQMDNSKGSKEGEEENDTVDAEDEFSLDFNHNDGKRIVMTLKRK